MNSAQLLKIADEIEADTLFQTSSYFDINLPIENCGCAVGRMAIAGGGVLESFPKDESEMAPSWRFYYNGRIRTICSTLSEIMNISLDEAVNYSMWTLGAPKERIVQSIKMMAENKWNWNMDPVGNFI
jgi:hypothetical protein